MQLEFTQLSASGWLLIPLGMIIGIIASRSRLRSTRTGLSWRAGVFRIVTACALVGALLGPMLVSEREIHTAKVLIDVSDSIDSIQGQRLLERVRELLSGSDAEIIPFAETTTASFLELQSLTSFQALKDSAGRLGIGQTNLESGFNEALRTTPLSPASDQGRLPLLLISDGFETLGNAKYAWPSLRESGLSVYPLTPEGATPSSSEFTISHMNVPLVAPALKSVDIRVSVKNGSEVTKRGTLRITHDERVVYEKIITVGAGKEELVIAPSDPSKDGIKKVVATLIPDDSSDSQTEKRAFLSGESREKVLVLHGSSADARFLDEVLRGQAYQVEASIARPSLEYFSQLNQYSSVVLNNVAAKQLPSAALNRLSDFVEQGGGLIVTGGDKSFGLGGYIGTLMERLLPVKMIPPQAEEKRLNVAVQLVIDKSQSMSSSQRLEFAKVAAREVVQNLKDEDYIGVIGFDETPYEVLRTMQVGGNREYAIERIGRLFPKGQTWLLPALREARRRLEAVPAGRKHMIIVTDGQLRDAGPIYLEDVKQARMLGITVSTVMIGGEYDFGFLRSLGEAGGGRFYSANDASQLPRIFIQDVKVRSGEQTMRENQEYPVRFGSGEVRSTSVRAFPPLKGFVETKIKPEANYELAVASGVNLKPLLASWDVGKGRVVAYTSDNNGRWSQDWVGWGRFVQFWSELVDATRSKSQHEGKNIRFDLRRYVERGSLMLDLAVFEDLDPAIIGATVTGPDGNPKEARFEKSSRGRYKLELRNAQAGVYQVQLKALQYDQNVKFTPVAFDVSGELFGERKNLGFNISFLEEAAKATGGKVNPTREELSGVKRKVRDSIDLRPYLLLFALIVFLLEVLVRQGVLPRWPRKALISRGA